MIHSCWIISRSLGQENLIMMGTPGPFQTPGKVRQVQSRGPQENSWQILDPDFLTCETKGFDQVHFESPSCSGNPSGLWGHSWMVIHLTPLLPLVCWALWLALRREWHQDPISPAVMELQVETGNKPLENRHGSDGKASIYNAGDLGSILGSGRSPGEGNGNPLQYYCLENPMDRGAW